MADKKETVLLLAPFEEEETVFARMLALELEEAGFSVQTAERTPRETEASLILASANAPDFHETTELSAQRGIPLVRYGDKGGEFVRPFAVDALIDRIRCLIVCRKKQLAAEQGDFFAGQGLMIGTSDRFVSYGGVPVGLTEREFRLLSYLAANRGNAVSREDILREVWEYSYSGDTNVVDVYIRYLRQKLDERFDVRLIATVRGKGYMLR